MVNFIYYLNLVTNILACLCVVYLFFIFGNQFGKLFIIVPFTHSIPIGYGEYWFYIFIINSVVFHIGNVYLDPNDPIIYDSAKVATECIVDSVEAKINGVSYQPSPEQFQIIKHGVARTTTLVICASISATIGTIALWYFSKKLNP
jgi:hypothetical protein